MNEEDGFHTIIDNCPDDWGTYLVFADWLQDRDDPRAAGYRALARFQRTCCDYDSDNGVRRFKENGNCMTWFNFAAISASTAKSADIATLDQEWFAKLSAGKKQKSSMWMDYESRRQGDNDAALAWSRMSIKNRSKLIRKYGFKGVLA